MSEQIVVGDWVVAGKDGTDGLDVGCILSLDGDMALVGWEVGGGKDRLDLTDDDVAVYARKDLAVAAYQERLAAKPVRYGIPAERDLES